MPVIPLLLLAATLQGCAVPGWGSSVPAGKGAITGGIQWCSGLRDLPGYAPGPVIVLRGWPVARSVRTEAWWRAHLRPIAQTHVRKNHTYRFIMPPGRYTVEAYLHGNYHPTQEVTVKQGAIVKADLLNRCM
jgi:hypothetical protein